MTGFKREIPCDRRSLRRDSSPKSRPGRTRPCASMPKGTEFARKRGRGRFRICSGGSFHPGDRGTSLRAVLPAAVDSRSPLRSRSRSLAARRAVRFGRDAPMAARRSSDRAGGIETSSDPQPRPGTDRPHRIGPRDLHHRRRHGLGGHPRRGVRVRYIGIDTPMSASIIGRRSPRRGSHHCVCSTRPGRDRVP